MAVKNFLGVFKTPTGVYFIDPKSGLITISVSSTGGVSSKPVLCTAGQTTPCWDFPAAGQLGNTPFNGWNGPSVFNQDLSIIKRTTISKISERASKRGRSRLKRRCFVAKSRTRTAGISNGPA